MKYEFIQRHRATHSVGMMCQILAVSRSGYYNWDDRTPSQRAQTNAALVGEIRRVYERSRGVYGSPRVTAELRAHGNRCGRHRVANLMRKHGIYAKTKRKFKVTTKANKEVPDARDLVKQHFVAEQPNQLWTSDITYLWTREGWAYLAVFLDVFSRRIVGWAMSARLTTELVTEAFKNALCQRHVARGLIVHTDRGSQYTSKEFQAALSAEGALFSVSESGNCYDNAITESFFHTFKTELIYFNRYETRNEARQSTFEYIEIFFNRKRRHSALNYATPLEFENQQKLS